MSLCKKTCKKNKNRNLVRIAAVALLGTLVLSISACSDPELKVTYKINGRKVEECPSQGLYEISSIRCSNKKANATWDNNTWSLKTDELTKNTSVDLDFTYTSHPFTVNGMGFDDLQSAFNAVSEGAHAEIHVTTNATGSGITPVGSDITLHLNGFTLDGQGNDTIVNCGTLTIIGNDAGASDDAASGEEKSAPARGMITNSAGSGETSKSLVNYGTLIANDVDFTNSTPSFTVWNSNNGQSDMTLNNCYIERTEADIIAFVNSGTARVSNSFISGGGDLTHPALLQNDGHASLEVTSSTIQNTGSGYSIHRESGTVSVDSLDSCPNSYGVN